MKQIKSSEVLSGSTFRYSDVFGNQENQFTINKGNEVKYFVYDQYCMNPSCECDEVILEFVENTMNAKSEFAIRLSLSQKKYLILDMYKVTNKEVEEIVKSLLRGPEIVDLFKKRYDEMKKKGMEALEEKSL